MTPEEAEALLRERNAILKEQAAARPEPTHLVRTECAGGCGSLVWSDPTRTGNRCTNCWHLFIGYSDTPPEFGKPDPAWSSANNPPPPDPTYPPGSDIVPFALTDPNLTLRCIRPACGNREWPIIDNPTPEQISASFAGHDRTWHTDDVWLVGGKGGATGEVCNPCAGYDWEKNRLPGGPNHAACRRGKGNGWQASCDCQHRSRALLNSIARHTPLPEETRADHTDQTADPELPGLF